MATRVYKPGWLKAINKIVSPRRTIKRWIKKRGRKIVKKKTVRMKAPPGMVRKGGWDSIQPGRTIIEWLPAPELGRGTVLAFLPGRRLDVLFESGGRPPGGVAIEEIRVLA